MIEVRNLCKSYEDDPALDNVTFSVQDGEVIGLLGPNGAGKTTLMKILTGFLQPDAGSASIAGLDVLDQCAAIQQLIGYLPENAPLYPELTVQSYLRMIADLRNVPGGMQQQRISEAVIRTGLTDRLTLPIGTLSKGIRQRVGLAQAILHRPSLLILDEPTNGLDPTQIAEVRNLIKKLAGQCTVIISTHILSEVEATCDRAIIIIKGRIKADARLSELAATSNARLILETTDPEGPRQILAGLPTVKQVSYDKIEKERISYLIKADSDQDLCPAIFALAKKHDWQLCELRQEVRTLEAVFNELAAAGGEK
ncbi:MAG: ABC transporter ATP-binding protein [Proteobacteria bacterium]|nr:ABC transporter ATP-binding protein [Pseudomonadota bacterium]MBU0968946.1 ABC transporter ATP-binding protein [Pseudomonadota bacterium]